MDINRNLFQDKYIFLIFFPRIFLCHVVVGKGKIYETPQWNLSIQKDVYGQGFDSVIGQVGKTREMDEVVVYEEEAVLPSYLIIYK